MSVEFTQYLRPNGRPVPTFIELCIEIEEKAKRFIDAGGWYTSELLSDEQTVSLAACFNVEHEDGEVEPDDICIILSTNGPAIPSAASRLITASNDWLDAWEKVKQTT